jgi:hypothetical protein
MKSLFFGAATFAVVAALYACSDSHTDGHDHTVPTDEAGGHTSPFPTCQKIIDACHEYDIGEGEVHDCHEVGHDAKDDTSCSAKLADCTRICAAAGADAGDADGSADAHAGHDQ